MTRIVNSLHNNLTSIHIIDKPVNSLEKTINISVDVTIKSLIIGILVKSASYMQSCHFLLKASVMNPVTAAKFTSAAAFCTSLGTKVLFISFSVAGGLGGLTLSLLLYRHLNKNNKAS